MHDEIAVEGSDRIESEILVNSALNCMELDVENETEYTNNIKEGSIEITCQIRTDKLRESTDLAIASVCEQLLGG